MVSRNNRNFIPSSVRKSLRNITLSEMEEINSNLRYDVATVKSDANESRLFHDLMHTWNLTPYITERLSVYELRTMYAPQLQENLRHHIGLVSFKGKHYVPIYQNCSRTEIGVQAASNDPQDHKYFISFREFGALRIALIQPEY